MPPKAKKICFSFILFPCDRNGLLLLNQQDMPCDRLQLVEELLMGLKSVSCSSLPPSNVHGRGTEPSKQHGRGKWRPLIHTAVICDKLHPVPCSTSLQQGRRLNSKTFSQFSPYLISTQQAAGSKKQSSTHSQ